MTCPVLDSHRGHKKENRDHMQIIHATDNRGCVSGLLRLHADIISMTFFVGVSDRCLSYCK